MAVAVEEGAHHAVRSAVVAVEGDHQRVAALRRRVETRRHVQLEALGAAVEIGAAGEGMHARQRQRIPGVLDVGAQRFQVLQRTRERVQRGVTPVAQLAQAAALLFERVGDHSRVE